MEFTNISTDDLNYFELSQRGRQKCEAYRNEMLAKKKEILDAGIDTADETMIPSVEEMFDDLLEFPFDSDGDTFDSFGVTDNYDADTVLTLRLGQDIIGYTTLEKLLKETDKALRQYSIENVSIDLNDEDGLLYINYDSRNNSFHIRDTGFDLIEMNKGDLMNELDNRHVGYCF